MPAQRRPFRQAQEVQTVPEIGQVPRARTDCGRSQATAQQMRGGASMATAAQRESGSAVLGTDGILQTVHPGLRHHSQATV